MSIATTALGTSSTATTTTTAASGSSGPAGAANAGAAGMQNTFLTLLVAQLKNQDPMNPLDNAQITSQLAQINTVNGIQQMNSSLQNLLSSMSAGQAFQAGAMVGRQVLAPGNGLTLAAAGGAAGGVQLAAAASAVAVQIVDASGKPVRTLQLGPQEAGAAPFQWDGLDDAGARAAAGRYSIKVTATSGAQNVTATPLASGTVSGVLTNSGSPAVRVDGIGNVPLQQVVGLL